MNPGLAIGTAMVKKRSIGEARSVAATSKGLWPMDEKAFCNGCTTKGIE